MIALRGILCKSDDDRWKWSGMWTFGQLPPEAGRDLSSINLKIPNVRPFHYTWDKAVSAAEVEVPSLLPREEDEEKLDEKDDQRLIENKEKDDREWEKRDGHVSVRNQQDADKKNPVEGVQEDTTVKASLQADKYNVSEKVTQETALAAKAQPDLGHISDGKVVLTGAALTEEHHEEAKFEEKKPLGITFSTMLPGEPEYREAFSRFPSECPPDGVWTGFFENIIRGRKAHNRVPESFSLFLNSMPPDDAQIIFPEDDEDPDSHPLSKPEDSAKLERDAACRLPEGTIHARGCGTNQYGVFELLGYFDRDTKVMELQRMYVSTNDPSPKPTTPPRNKSSLSSPKQSSHDPSNTRSSYSTRKRQLSWQRKSTLSDGEEEIVGMRRHPITTAKKRSRTSSTSGEKRPHLSTKAISTEESSSKVAVASERTDGESNDAKQGSPTSASSLPIIPGPKKRAQGNHSASSPNTLKLPSIGDPSEARWRAAHYFYYQRHDNSTDEGGSAPSSGSTLGATSTRFVVYEGEMNHGKRQRDGRGVCLYNNGTLYEGEWKRNREHGKGRLMTSDRRHTIYQGDWERGKIHGQGTYFFRAGESIFSSSSDLIKKVVPRYDGEFKENARHGNGKYYLPDGSTYEGEWRDNLMSGKGIFIWPDGSIYSGQFKDGKRHGQGLLQCSDKFNYDGQWVHNAMEGRGIATYPGGQIYEGLFSNGRREGRGTIYFTNGAVYEGRFRDDAIEGQGTMKMSQCAKVEETQDTNDEEKPQSRDWMIPISFQSDMTHIHRKAGFTMVGE